MKDLFVVFILLLSLSLISAEEITLNVGESKEVNSNLLKLKNLKSDKVVISVNNESKIFELNDEETILGVRIRVKEIFYFDPSDGYVIVEITSLFVCGNGVCDDSETSETCCQDCTCPSGYDCDGNKCIHHVEHECNSDSDCNDNNEDTLDKCKGTPRKCSHLSTIICTTNEDCDDSRVCTKDSCINNDCKNTKIENCTSGTEQFPGEESLKNQTNQTKEKELVPKGESFFSRLLNILKRIFTWRVQ